MSVHRIHTPKVEFWLHATRIRPPVLKKEVNGDKTLVIASKSKLAFIAYAPDGPTRDFTLPTTENILRFCLTGTYPGCTFPFKKHADPQYQAQHDREFLIGLDNQNVDKARVVAVHSFAKEDTGLMRRKETEAQAGFTVHVDSGTAGLLSVANMPDRVPFTASVDLLRAMNGVTDFDVGSTFGAKRYTVSRADSGVVVVLESQEEEASLGFGS